MDAAELLEHCLAKPGAWSDHPFDPVWPVVKVAPAGKIFCFVNEHSCGVKAGPDREVADVWLDRYPHHASSMPYLGGRGWNQLVIDAGIPADEIRSAVDDSYLIVVGKLPRTQRPRGWKQ
ncbi:hypothetical protein D9V37_12120 [Nocardioides mangrovicus]|uniref:MmcQ/YjbR family DNA-binding protein n=1 Tax=Nocardioides mangrovicus TaxID=2478913 RepID=A0A3L8P2A5_9ACTN|nr:MmcQ/YjbR family DNA-binding protein [Nocardioides mangrovicus]RLV49284.1 hypothetical protein D9V37_12120 [Nocardioides mangrovicus]